MKGNGSGALNTAEDNDGSFQSADIKQDLNALQEAEVEENSEDRQVTITHRLSDWRAS